MTTPGSAFEENLKFKPRYQALCKILVLVAGLLTSLLFCVWLISIDFTIQQHTKLLSQSSASGVAASDHQSNSTNAVAKTGSPSAPTSDNGKANAGYRAVLEPHVPASFRPWLFPLYGIDLSTVTALLIWYFTFRVCRGAWFVAVGRTAPAVSETFPFPRNFVNTWVQLGLIGTLWGFLLLGFGLKGRTGLRESEAIINLLIQAFGTALLSTFVAVVLAYVAAPLVQTWFSRCFVQSVGPTTKEKASAEFLVWIQKVNDSFRELAIATDANRGEFVKTFDSLKTEVNALKDRVETFFSMPASPLNSLNTKVDELKGQLAGLGSKVGELKEPIVKVEAAVKARRAETTQDFRSLSQSIADSSRSSVETMQNSAERTRKAVVDALQELANAQGRDSRHLDSLIEKLNTLCDELHAVRAELGRLPTALADQQKRLIERLNGTPRPGQDGGMYLVPRHTGAHAGLQKSRWWHGLFKIFGE